MRNRKKSFSAFFNRPLDVIYTELDWCLFSCKINFQLPATFLHSVFCFDLASASPVIFLRWHAHCKEMVLNACLLPRVAVTFSPSKWGQLQYGRRVHNCDGCTICLVGVGSLFKLLKWSMISHILTSGILAMILSFEGLVILNGRFSYLG